MARSGQLVEMAQHVMRLIAPNPSPMTYWGTNTYILGKDRLTIIDPGPSQSVHFNAICQAINGRAVDHILVTHAHLDHSPLARRLSQYLNTPVYAFGPAQAGRSKVMQKLDDATRGGEGVDLSFKPDRTLRDAQELNVDGTVLRALHTPGHMGNHLCFEYSDLLFSGDLVMGWSTSLISPPDGDLRQFMNSCARLQSLTHARYLPGHGDPIEQPQQRVAALIAHRESRHEAIRTALSERPGTPAELVARLYHDVPRHLWPVAQRNILAHLIALCETGEAAARPTISHDAQFQLA